MLDRELYDFLFPKKELLLEKIHPRDYLEDKDEKITQYLERDFPREKVDSDLTMNLFNNYKRIPIDLLKGKLFIFGISGSGKTIEENHRTFTKVNDNYFYKKLKEVNKGEYTLTTDGNYHKVIEVKKHKINNNVKIKTKLGYEIIATKDHSLLTCNDFEIIPITAEKCKKGTLIPLLCKKMLEGNITFENYVLNYEMGRLCGFYIAKNENYTFPTSLLKYFYDSSKNIKIPKWVFSSCFDFRKGFLSGFFWGKGCKNKKSSHEILSISEDLINDFMKLFQTIGIVCKKQIIWKKNNGGEKEKYFKISMVFECNYFEDIEQIIKNRTSIDNEIQEATLEKDKKIIDFLKLPIYWDEIQDIIEVPEELNGVDLEIENNHTFLGDGIFVHNSEGLGVILEELSNIRYPFTAFDPAGDFISIIQINPELKVYHVSKIKGKERELAREAYEKGYQVVINMEGEIDIEVRRKCVLEYLTEIQQLSMKYKEKNQGLVHAIVMDEVKDYIPSISSGTSARTPTLNLIRALIGWFATDGRKYGTTMICASQRPTYLETGITSQFQNYFLMRVESVDLEKYREFMKTGRGKVGSSDAQIMFRLMKPGEAWINLTGGRPFKVRFRRRITTHKGKTPSLTESRSIFEKNRRKM